MLTVEQPRSIESAAPVEQRCRRCGYSLRGLNESRCPECGKEFDPRDPLTTDNPRRTEHYRRRRGLWLGPLAVWAFITSAATIALARAIRDPGENAVYLIAFGLPVGWWARRRTRRALLAGDAEPEPQHERVWTNFIWLTAVTVILATSPVRTWSCPHGWACGFGPIGIAHSEVGGPCRNTVPDLRAVHVGGAWYVWTTV